ncbi:MAG: ribbon-helix-helix domain-containing protein [Parasphingopyxis sp.]
MVHVFLITRQNNPLIPAKNSLRILRKNASMNACIHVQENAVVKTSAAKRTAGKTPIPPSRIGKKGVTFYLKPDAMKQLRTIAVEEEATLQSLMIEAANLLFETRGKRKLAE